MKLHTYRDIARRRWLDVIMVLLLATAASAAITLMMPTRYTATVRVFVHDQQESSYAAVALSPLVLEPVIDRLQLTTSATTLAEQVSAVTSPGAVLEISVVDRDAARAAGLANAVGDEVTTVVADLSPQRADGSKAAKATILAPALVPTRPSSPNMLRNLVGGALLGILLGGCVAIVRDVSNVRVRTGEQAAVITGRPVLAAIGFDQNLRTQPIIVRDQPSSAAAEALLQLRASLQFTGLDKRPHSIVVTSSVTEEGKSMTAMNLAAALADTGARVVLVDADLRQPSVASSLGLEGSVGLTTVLAGRAAFDDVVQPWRDTSLDILPSGRLPPNPTELLGSAAMTQLLTELTDRYDSVLLDTAPLLTSTEAAVLSGVTTGTLLVVGVNRTRRSQLRAAISSLAAAGARVHGVVVNRPDRRRATSPVEGSRPTQANEPAVDQASSTTAGPTAPKRARLEPATGTTAATVLASGGPPNPRAEGSANGSEPPSTRRVTPVGS